jgi:hypothetical protein
MAVAAPATSQNLLIKSQYWELHEIRFAKIVVLKRTGAVITSTSQLRSENLAVVECLNDGHRAWGGVVDMRSAPARNDVDFEQAMRFLRHRLSKQLARLSVLVSSAAGLLQVSRIDRGDGTTTHVTQDEKEAIRYAEGG